MLVTPEIQQKAVAGWVESRHGCMAFYGGCQGPPTNRGEVRSAYVYQVDLATVCIVAEIKQVEPALRSVLAVSTPTEKEVEDQQLAAYFSRLIAKSRDLRWQANVARVSAFTDDELPVIMDQEN